MTRQTTIAERLQAQADQWHDTLAADALVEIRRLQAALEGAKADTCWRSKTCVFHEVEKPTTRKEPRREEKEQVQAPQEVLKPQGGADKAPPLSH